MPKPLYGLVSVRTGVVVVVARGMELAADLVRLHLESNLQANIDVINTAYTDFDLEPIGTFLDAERYLRAEEFPVIFVVGDVTPNPVKMRSRDANHVVTTAIWVQSSDPSVVRRSLYRYADAVMQTIEAMTAFTLPGDPWAHFEVKPSATQNVWEGIAEVKYQVGVE